jgi:hypothetical protein
MGSSLVPVSKTKQEPSLKPDPILELEPNLEESLELEPNFLNIKVFSRLEPQVNQ